MNSSLILSQRTSCGVSQLQLIKQKVLSKKEVRNNDYGGSGSKNDDIATADDNDDAKVDDDDDDG